MSVAIRSLVSDLKVGGMLEKFVLFTLAGLANHSGSCWPSHKELAEIVEADEAEIGVALDRLEAKGLIYRAPTIGLGRVRETVILIDEICRAYAAQIGRRGDEASVGERI